MSRLIRLPFLSRRKAPDAVPQAEPVATSAPAVPRRRVGLWVLSVFVTVAALVVISALVIGPQNAEIIVLVPLALFWTVVVCAAFAVRAAMINIARNAVQRHADKPDVADERLARMVRAERRREAQPRHPHGLLHAV